MIYKVYANWLMMLIVYNVYFDPNRFEENET